MWQVVNDRSGKIFCDAKDLGMSFAPSYLHSQPEFSARANDHKVRTAVIRPMKMLRDERMAVLRRLRCAS